MLTYGFVALGNHTLQDFNYSTKAELREDNPHFSTTFDNYLQWSPAAAVYLLNLAGVHGEHNFRDRTIIYGMSTLIMASSVKVLKTTTHVQRPDGSNYESFPSGHTATAFAAAEFMRLEYQHTSPVLSVTGYVAAAATGALRMYNNRHWFSDIAGGAGIGILSTQAAYALYPVVKRHLFASQKHTSTLLMPYYDPELKAGGCRLLVVAK
jgi:membrane-associated phospholipid phosphatase